jgi:hypothetical protein
MLEMANRMIRALAVTGNMTDEGGRKGSDWRTGSFTVLFQENRLPFSCVKPSNSQLTGQLICGLYLGATGATAATARLDIGVTSIID